MNSGNMFGHKGLVVVSLAFWVIVTFDSTLSMRLVLKSSFESYLANSSKKNKNKF